MKLCFYLFSAFAFKAELNKGCQLIYCTQFEEEEQNDNRLLDFKGVMQCNFTNFFTLFLVTVIFKRVQIIVKKLL